MLPCEKRGFIINTTSLSLLLLSSVSATHSAITCDSTAGENFTGSSFKQLMVKRDPGSQDTCILFLDLTLTHGMVSAHLFVPPEDTEETAFIKCFHMSIAAALSGKTSHLHVSCHILRLRVPAGGNQRI